MQTTEMREKQISLRFSAEEWARAEAVAATHGLNVQNVIRFLLKREADTIAEFVTAPRHSLAVEGVKLEMKSGKPAARAAIHRRLARMYPDDYSEERIDRALRELVLDEQLMKHDGDAYSFGDFKPISATPKK